MCYRRQEHSWGISHAVLRRCPNYLKCAIAAEEVDVIDDRDL